MKLWEATFGEWKIPSERHRYYVIAESAADAVKLANRLNTIDNRELTSLVRVPGADVAHFVEAMNYKVGPL